MIQLTILWDVMPNSLISGHQQFRETPAEVK